MPNRILHRSACRRALALLVFSAASAGAQRSITRAEAERIALASGARVALARADTAVAVAKLRTAKALPNPILTASLSKSVPQKHVSVEVPVFDVLYTRGRHVGLAETEVRASRLLYASERLAAFVEVDTTYTLALAKDARFRISRQTARDADSLTLLTTRRRDAGDAADLDVDLAMVTAGQLVNAATDDSLSAVSSLLALQTLMGLPSDSVSIVLTDSLVLQPRDTATVRMAMGNSPVMLALPAPIASPFAPSVAAALAAAPSVLAAEASFSAAEQAVGVQRHSVWQLPSVNFGFEQGDDSQPGILPTFGIGFQLPLFSRNQGRSWRGEVKRERSTGVQLMVVRTGSQEQAHGRRAGAGTARVQGGSRSRSRDSRAACGHALGHLIPRRSVIAFRRDRGAPHGA